MGQSGNMAAYCCKVRLGENGEVAAYSENADGTITLVVDGVWADYNSDLAFTNRIVVQPLEIVRSGIYPIR